MFPLDLRTPADEVEKALKKVFLEPGQRPAMCNACGRWRVVDEHEYTTFGDTGHRYPRIRCCPECGSTARK